MSEQPAGAGDHGRPGPVRIVRTRIVGSVLGRIDIEWVLDRRPDLGWLDEFATAVEDIPAAGRGGPGDLCARYGAPSVDDDGRIRWAVDESAMAGAAALIWEAVRHADARSTGGQRSLSRR